MLTYLILENFQCQVIIEQVGIDQFWSQSVIDDCQNTGNISICRNNDFIVGFQNSEFNISLENKRERIQTISNANAVRNIAINCKLLFKLQQLVSKYKTSFFKNIFRFIQKSLLIRLIEFF